MLLLPSVTGAKRDAKNQLNAEPVHQLKTLIQNLPSISHAPVLNSSPPQLPPSVLLLMLCEDYGQNLVFEKNNKSMIKILNPF